MLTNEIEAKRWLLHELIPTAPNIAVLGDPDSPVNDVLLKDDDILRASQTKCGRDPCFRT
jgi:hypothetical protein